MASAFETALWACLNAALTQTFLVLLGALFTYYGVFDHKNISDLGRLVYYVSLPCLLFSKIAYVISAEELGTVWGMDAICMIHVFGAMLISFVLSKLCGLNSVERVGFQASMMFGNTGSLTIAVLGTLCYIEPLQQEAGPMCMHDGTAYVAFYLLGQNLIMFTVGAWLITTMHVPDYADQQQAPVEQVETSKDDDETPLLPKGAPRLPKTSSSPALGAYKAPPRGSQVTFKSSTFTGNMGPRRMTVEDLEHVASHLALNTLALAPMVMNDDAEDGVVWRESMIPGVKTPYPSMVNLRAVYESSEESYMSDDLGLDSDASDSEIQAQIIKADEEAGGTEGQTKREGSPQDLGDATGEKGMREHKNSKLRASMDDMREREKTTPIESAFDTRNRSCVQVQSTLLKIFTNPSVCAALSAIVLGCIPFLKDLFIGDAYSILNTHTPPLHSVYNAISILGAAQVPVSMLMLSGSGTLKYLSSLQDQTGQTDTFSPVAQFLILTGRVIIMPGVGLLTWRLMKSTQYGPFQNNGLFALVALVESCVPTAQNVIMLLLHTGNAAHAHSLALLVLKQMAICIPIFTFFTAYCLVYETDFTESRGLLNHTLV